MGKSEGIMLGWFEGAPVRRIREAAAAALSGVRKSGKVPAAWRVRPLQLRLSAPQSPNDLPDAPLKQRVAAQFKLPEYTPPDRETVLLSALAGLLAPAPARARAFLLPFRMAADAYAEQLQRALREAEITARFAQAEAELRRAEAPVAVAKIQSADKRLELEQKREQFGERMQLDWYKAYLDADIGKAEIAERQARALNLDADTQQRLMTMPVRALADLDRALQSLGSEQMSPATQRAANALLIDVLSEMESRGLPTASAVEILRQAQQNPEQLRSYRQMMYDLQVQRAEQEIERLQAQTQLTLEQIGLTRARTQQAIEETKLAARRVAALERQVALEAARLQLAQQQFAYTQDKDYIDQLRAGVETFRKAEQDLIRESFDLIRLYVPSERLTTVVDQLGTEVSAGRLREVWQRNFPNTQVPAALLRQWESAQRAIEEARQQRRKIEATYKEVLSP